MAQIGENPNDFDALLSLGDLEALGGDTVLAATYYSRALSVRKTSGVLKRLGTALLASGRAGEAASRFEEALAVLSESYDTTAGAREEHVDILRRLAAAFRASGDRAGAMEVYTNMERLLPGASWPILQKAAIAGNGEQDPTTALEVLEKALAGGNLTDPDAVFEESCRLYALSGGDFTARRDEYFEKRKKELAASSPAVLASDPSGDGFEASVAAQLKGLAYVGQTMEADSFSAAILEKRPGSPAALSWACPRALARGEAERVIELAASVEKGRPAPEVLRACRDALLILDRPAAARRAASQILGAARHTGAASPTPADAVLPADLRGMGACEEAMGNPFDAAGYYEAALKADPGDAGSREGLARVALETGRTARMTFGGAADSEGATVYDYAIEFEGPSSRRGRWRSGFERRVAIRDFDLQGWSAIDRYLLKTDSSGRNLPSYDRLLGLVDMSWGRASVFSAGTGYDFDLGDGKKVGLGISIDSGGDGWGTGGGYFASVTLVPLRYSTMTFGFSKNQFTETPLTVGFEMNIEKFFAEFEAGRGKRLGLLASASSGRIESARTPYGIEVPGIDRHDWSIALEYRLSFRPRVFLGMWWEGVDFSAPASFANLTLDFAPGTPLFGSGMKAESVMPLFHSPSDLTKTGVKTGFERTMGSKMTWGLDAAYLSHSDGNSERRYHALIKYLVNRAADLRLDYTKTRRKFGIFEPGRYEQDWLSLDYLTRF